MKIIISPAKRFKQFDDFKTEKLLFEDKSKKLIKILKEFSIGDLANELKCNDELAIKAYYDYKEFDFKKLKNPAIFSYDGLVFKQFTRDDFKDLNYLNENVYIISALYGLLKPLTGIRDYRLDMNIKKIDLYDFWKDSIYRKIFSKDKLVINLASKEYSKLIENYTKNDDRFVTINFKENKNGKHRSVVSYTKIMRGKMLKYLVNEKIRDVEEIKKIKIDGYIYNPLTSTKNTLNFVRG